MSEIFLSDFYSVLLFFFIRLFYQDFFVGLLDRMNFVFYTHLKRMNTIFVSLRLTVFCQNRHDKMSYEMRTIWNTTMKYKL